MSDWQFDEKASGGNWVQYRHTDGTVICGCDREFLEAFIKSENERAKEVAT